MPYDFTRLPQIDDFDVVVPSEQFTWRRNDPMGHFIDCEQERFEPEKCIAYAKQHHPKTCSISFFAGTMIIPVNGNMTPRNLEKMVWLLGHAYKFSSPEKISVDINLGTGSTIHAKLPKEVQDGFAVAVRRYLDIAKSIFDNTNQPHHSPVDKASLGNLRYPSHTHDNSSKLCA